MSLQNKEACHVFRFIRRDCLGNIPGVLGEAVTPRTIFEEPPAGDDIILVTKHLLGSQSYAQEPLVFSPGSRFRALPAEGPGAISGRVQFSPRQQKEFTRTAQVIEQSPWNMKEAHNVMYGCVHACLFHSCNVWMRACIHSYTHHMI